MKECVAPGVLAALMMGGFAMMSAQMNGVRSDLTAEIRDVRNDVDQVRADVGDVHAALADVRAELAGTQAEVAGMRAELAAVRNEVADFRARLRAVEIGFGKVDQRLLTLERVLLPGREPPGE